MRTSIKTLLASALVGASALVSVPAFAEETAAPGDFTISGYVQGVSDYRFRGMSASGGDPAIQGAINVNHSSGFYVGAWASSLEETPTMGSTELDLLAGWTGEVTPGLTADVGLTYYVYPSGDVGNANFFEPYASLSTTVGPVEAKAGVSYSWKQSALLNDAGQKDDNLYVYTDLSTGIPNTPVTVVAHLGYTSGPLSPAFLTSDTGYDGFDYSVGATYNLNKNLSLGVAYLGHDGSNLPSMSNDTAVVTIKLAL